MPTPISTKRCSASARSAFGFQGQKCSACSRVIVLEEIYEPFVARLVEAAKSSEVGPAEEPGTRSLVP